VIERDRPRYHPVVTDTTVDAAEVQRAVLRAMPAGRKLELFVHTCEAIRELSLSGIRARHPEYSRREAQLALWRMLHGDELFRRAWPREALLSP
jgi:hypothetical protein